MARIESVAVGGYYKTPPHLVPLIAQVLDPNEHSATICDPCAGDGEAADILGQNLEVYSKRFYTAELEETRAKQAKARFDNNCNSLHCDAFNIFFESAFANVLYLNPPYDTDRVHGRLEQKFLSRFKDALVSNGVLVFIVPFYALKASKETLATHFADVSCWRFPVGDYDAYKQVVLMARKTNRLGADPLVEAQVDHWVESPDTIPVLGKADSKLYRLPDPDYHYNNWVVKTADFIGLSRKYRPWRFTAAKSLQNVPHILPEVPVADLLFREYPVATLPRPAHIAAGIASGMFNGRRVESDKPGFPPILVKGVFDREFETVRENTNKEGEVTSVVQVQKPKLVTTIFDLDALEYRTLHNEGGKTKGLTTLEDLLEHYGSGLMHVMSKQCPVLYDPARDQDSVTLAPLGRNLFTAQAHATKALVTLLNTKRAAILIGEIGSGKTSCALAAAKTIGKNLLVMCPPHLLDSWRDETAKVLPEAHIRVLESVTDVDALHTIPKDEFFVAILSRETAKLGHALKAVTKRCPKCGSALADVDFAKKRERCGATKRNPLNWAAEAVVELATKLFPYYAGDFQVRKFFRNPVHFARAQRPSKVDWKEIPCPSWIKHLTNHRDTLAWALHATCTQDQIRDYVKSCDSRYNAAELAYLLHPEDSEIDVILSYAHEWGMAEGIRKYQEGKTVKRDSGQIQFVDGVTLIDGVAPRSKEAVKRLFEKLINLADFQKSAPCGEFLYQSTPSPRRYPLAKYISKHHKKLFSVYAADECHEYATEGSAQERASHRICNLNIPTIQMTGSLMNGYAESLFTNMWSVSRSFRTEFGRDESARFVERYGYRERVVSDRDDATGDLIEFGSCTDRVTRSARMTGDAPGILPLFLFRHLLAISVTLHKGDLAIDLPPCVQHRHLIPPTPALMKSYTQLLNGVLKQISKDRFEKEKAGKLFGALAELPSYLDRASENIGNQADGTYEVRYPETLDRELVATGESFPYDEILPKEQWLLDTTASELKEGRNVLVFAWHVNVIPRIAKLLKEQLGEEVVVLYADKVPTKKRQSWINAQVVSKGVRIMVANPMTVQTGLNNLVHFNTEIWMENPAANPQVFRQAVGRIDRIGAKKETRVHFAIYDKTIQVQMYDLLMKKVAISTATDGLDPESVILASGGSSSYMSGLSLGRQLWEMLNKN